MSLHALFLSRLGGIDLAAIVVLTAVHISANAHSPQLSDDGDERERDFGFVRDAIAAAMTAAGILMPLALAVVAVLADQHSVSKAVVGDVVLAQLWLGGALLVGAVALGIASYAAPRRNAFNVASVRILLGPQLILIGAGVIRLFLATYTLAGQLK